ncbi:MAG: lactonase family protein [bacterium]|nr:lactonase family protein [bacterium]
MKYFSRILSILILAVGGLVGGLGACNGLLGVPCNDDDPGCNASLFLLQFIAATRTNNFGTHAYVVDGTANVKSYTVDRTTGLLTAGGQLNISSNPEDAQVDATGNFLYVGNVATSDGLYAYSLAADPAQPVALTGSPFLAGVSRPTELSLDRANNRIYAALQANQAEGYAIDAATGAISLLSGSPFGVGCITTVEYNSATSPTFASYRYGVNEFQSFSIDSATGTVSALQSFPSAFIPAQLDYSPDGNFLYVTNAVAGLENVLIAQINADGTFTTASGSPVAFGPTNEQAIDLDVSASGSLVYVANSTTNGVYSYSIDTSTGAMTSLGAPITTAAGLSALKLSPDDQYLYAGHGTGITIYSVGTSGALTEVGSISGLTNVENIVFRQQSETLF